MAYKQPGNTPMHGASMQGSNNNDGASILPIAGLIGLGKLLVGTKVGGAIAGAGKALGGKIAAGVGKGIAKVAPKAVAKLKTKAVAKSFGKQSGNLVGKHSSLAADSGSGLTKKAGRQLIRSTQEKATQGLSGSTKRGIKQGVKQSMKTGLDDISGKTIGQSVSGAVDKAKSGIDKAADKIGQATGKDKAEILEIGKGKLEAGAVTAATAGADKLNKSNKQIDASKYMSKNSEGIDDNLPNSSSYSNPSGPSMKTRKTRSSGNIPSVISNAKYHNSTDASNMKDGASAPYGYEMKKTSPLDNFSAPVNIGGITVDLGDVMRAGKTGYGLAKKGIEKHKIKKIARSKQLQNSSKNPPSNASIATVNNNNKIKQVAQSSVLGPNEDVVTSRKEAYKKSIEADKRRANALKQNKPVIVNNINDLGAPKDISLVNPNK
tara:strand:+ start:2464 stop:3765 length:1302 start_codon:yes stop_codon:yes gene_type:complete